MEDRGRIENTTIFLLKKDTVEQHPSTQESNKFNEEKTRLLEMFRQDVFFRDGEPEAELRVYVIESFIEQCNALEHSPPEGQDPLYIRIQREFFSSLSPEEIHELACRIPKGAKVRIETRRHIDGSSPIANAFWSELIQNHGLHTTDESGEIRVASEEEKKEILGFLSKKPIFTDVQEGIIEAEPIQGYAGGGIRLRGDNGEIMGISVPNISSFIILGTSSNYKDKLRRPRELYPGRLVWIYHNGQWVEGALGSNREPLPDECYVYLHSHVMEPTILGVPRMINRMTINVGKPSQYEEQRGGAISPSKILLGSANFEQYPYLFENIRFENTEFQDQSGSLESNNRYKVGNVLIFPDGRIGRVINSSQEQCMCRVKFGPHLFETYFWQLTSKEEPTQIEFMRLNCPESKKQGKLKSFLSQIIRREKLTPETLDREGRRVFLSKKIPDGISLPKGYVLQISGIYLQEDTEYVLFEAIPCWLGSKANIPEKQFYSLPLSQYEQLIQQGIINESNETPFAYLQRRFPDVADKILQRITDDGIITHCTVILKDGTTIVENSSVFLGVLPFYIACIPNYPKNYTVSFINPDDIASIHLS